jgi:hypothetical protein
MDERKIREILSKKLFVEEQIIEYAVRALHKNNRVHFFSDELHIKICDPYAEKFESALQNQIKIYENYKEFFIPIPELVYAFFDGVCIIATRKIDGQPLGAGRNDFRLNRAVDIGKIIKSIGDIRKFPIVDNWKGKKYDRNEKITEYADSVRKYLGDELYEDIFNSITTRAGSPPKICFSHGDLLPSNIIMDKNEDLWFVDWEWAMNRTEFYDITYFTLFSHSHDENIAKLSQLTNDKQCLAEMYCDSVSIALHEIKNWQNSDFIGKEYYMCMWKKTLKKALNGLEII